MIKDLLKKYEEIHKLDKDITEKILSLRESSKERMVTINRDGKDVEVREYDLWEEVRNLAKTDAIEKLKELYPKEMSLIIHHQELIDESNKFMAEEYGIFPHEMRLSKLVIFMRDLIKEENENSK